MEQNEKGDYFAITYIDDGQFRLRHFGIEERDQLTIDATELKINERLGLNDHTIPIYNFPDPFISCTFINHELIFVNFFHNATYTHYHFVYNFIKDEITS